jgi:hypothetical protein
VNPSGVVDFSFIGIEFLGVQLICLFICSLQRRIYPIGPRSSNFLPTLPVCAVNWMCTVCTRAHVTATGKNSKLVIYVANLERSQIAMVAKSIEMERYCHPAASSFAA